MVGVTGVLVVNSGSLRRGQSSKFWRKTPVLFLSEQSRMSTLSIQKVKRKPCSQFLLRYSAKHIWPCLPNSEVPEKHIVTSRVVLLCWILIHSHILLLCMWQIVWVKFHPRIAILTELLGNTFLLHTVVWALQHGFKILHKTESIMILLGWWVWGESRSTVPNQVDSSGSC